MSAAFLLDVLIAAVMLTWATMEDVKSYTITLLPILLGTIGGLVVSITFHGWRGIVESVVGGLVGGGIGWLFVRGVRLGEGDALLYLALGTIFGASTVMVIVGISQLLVLIRFVKPLVQKRKICVAVVPYIATGTAIVLLVNHIV